MPPFSEDRIREIVNEELARREADARAISAAATEQWLAQHKAEVLEQIAPDPKDGPLVSEIKAMFRKDYE